MTTQLDRLAVLAVLGLLTAALPGCPADPDDPRPSCSAPAAEELDANVANATVGEDDWTGSTQGYQWVGTQQIFSSLSDGTTTLTVRLVESTVFEAGEGDPPALLESDGDTIDDVFADRSPPVDFRLGDAADDGADATLTVSSKTHHTNEEGGGGFLRITEFEEDEDTGDLLGFAACFFLDAGSATDDAVVPVAGGTLRVGPL